MSVFSVAPFHLLTLVFSACWVLVFTGVVVMTVFGVSSFVESWKPLFSTLSTFYFDVRACPLPRRIIITSRPINHVM